MFGAYTVFDVAQRCAVSASDDSVLGCGLDKWFRDPGVAHGHQNRYCKRMQLVWLTACIALVAGACKDVQQTSSSTTPAKTGHPSSSAVQATPHKDYVRRLAMSHQGNLAATWARDGLRLWEADSGAERCKITLSGTRTSHRTRLRDEDIRPFQLPTDVTSLAFSGDGRTLLVAAADGTVRRYDTASCDLALEHTLPGEGPAVIAVSSRDVWLAGRATTLELWRGARDKEPALRATTERPIDQLAVDPQGTRVAVVTAQEEFAFVEQREVAAFDRATALEREPGESRYWTRGGETLGIITLFYNAEGTRLAVYDYAEGHETRLSLWNAKGERERELSFVAEPDEDPGRVDAKTHVTLVNAGLDFNSRFAFSADGTSLFVAADRMRQDIPDHGRAWVSANVLATVEPGTGTVTTREVKLDVLTTNIAQSTRWAFDSLVAPKRVIYGDQDGNVAVISVMDGRVLWKIDKSAYGRASEADCQSLVGHIAKLANASTAQIVSAGFTSREEVANALAKPDMRSKIVSECSKVALRPDVDCYLRASTYEELVENNCHLGDTPFP